MLLVFCCVICCNSSVLPAITIDFRLACDLGSTCGPGDFFFDHPEGLEDLEFVAQAYSPFADSLTSISGATVNFTHPDTGAALFTLGNFSVPADTVIIYVGGRDLPSNEVAVAGPGGPNGSFDRGQGTISGGSADDFAMWGGSMSFDTKTAGGADRNWHFGADTSPAPFTVDFISVALHELAHVFGFGTSDSFENQITANEFQARRHNQPTLFRPTSGVVGAGTNVGRADRNDPTRLCRLKRFGLGSTRATTRLARQRQRRRPCGRFRLAPLAKRIWHSKRCTGHCGRR